MESKRLVARSILQRALTLSKPANEQQLLPPNVLLPTLNKYLIPPPLLNLETTVTNQSPRSLNHSLGPMKKFDFSRAQRLIESELNRRCNRISKTTRYDHKISMDLARDLVLQLRRILKAEYLNSVRYKVVVLVSIVQTVPNRQTHQSIAIVSRCLWNQDTDGSITVQAKIGHDMTATATAFMVYTD